MQLLASRECQVDDLKEAAQKPFALALCPFWFEAIKQKNPNTVSCDAYELDIYHQEESFACHKHTRAPICSILSPLTVSQLDFAGRPLGQGSQDVSKSARHR